MLLDLATRFERLVLDRLDALLDGAGGALFGLSGRKQRRQQEPGAERDQTDRQGIALSLLLDHLGRLSDLFGSAAGGLLSAFLGGTRHVAGAPRRRRARL